MIVTRSPLRITLGGGGSDLGPGGYCIAAAIDKFVTIAVTESFDDNYVLRYSQNERVASVDEIEHRILRETLRKLDMAPGLEISSTADIPAGTGLGSSGAFTVGLVHALLRDPSRPEIARLACELDIGKQDQYAAVYGGCNAFDFEAGTIRPIETTIDRHLGLYYTGWNRATANEPDLTVFILRRDEQNEADSIKALIENDVVGLGACLYRQWDTKLKRDPTKFHQWADELIYTATHRHFAYGGKVVGAGGGGFILIAGDNLEVANYMKERGLRRVPFRFDHQGTTVLAT